MGTDVNEGGWGDEIKQILKSLESTPKTIFALQQWLWENVTADDCIPRSMPTAVRRYCSIFKKHSIQRLKRPTACGTVFRTIQHASSLWD